MIKIIKNNEELVSYFFVVLCAMLVGMAIVSEKILLYFPLFLLASYGWLRFASRYRAGALIIIVIFSESLFFITDLGLSRRLLSDVALILMLPIIVLNFRRVWYHVVVDRSPYAIGILCFFCAILISIIYGSYIKFGQPIPIGMIVARKHLLFCSYFFFIAVGATQNDVFVFLKYLAWLGAAIAILTIIETFLGGGVIFSKYYAVGQERAGQLRIHIASFLIIFAAIYSFLRSQYTEENKAKLVYLFLAGICLFDILFVMLTRAVFLGLLITFLFWMIVTKKSHKKIFLLCGFVSVIIIVTLTGIADKVISESFIGEILSMSKTEVSSDKGNVSIRKEGASYYLDLTLKNAPLTGVGIFSSTKFPNNPITIARETYSYHMVDINGLSTVIYFGVQGLILLIFFVFKSTRDVLIVCRNENGEIRFNFEVILLIFVYTMATPSLNNILVERMLLYTGVFLYVISITLDENKFKLVKYYGS